VEQVQPGTPGKYLPGTAGWPNRTIRSYDELGRVVRKEWWRGSVLAHATTTAYGVDTVTVTGPDGRRVRERIDGLGRTVEVAERDGQGWVSSEYGYDLADRLVSVTDPAGNQNEYSYNLAGWRTGQADPNRGSATFAYDEAGNQTSTIDALGNEIHTNYDALGRRVERRAEAPTGPLLASWEYDTAPGGIGRPHRELTHTTDGTWVSEVLAYDAKGRSTGSRLVVPGGIPGLSDAYVTTQTYDRADRVRSITYPAIGGLPGETVTTDYNDSGLATRMAGLAEYVWGVTYDDRGRRVSAGFGPRPGGEPWLAKSWTYNADQQLSGSQTFIAGASVPDGIISDHELTFDPAGNLTEKVTRQDGLAWRECLGYDSRSRLTSAHTVAAGSSCAGGQPGTGDRPYQHSYSYSPDGRLLERVQDGASTSYAYPAAGAPHPHAPTGVGGDTYSWDGTGNLVSRTVDGAEETFAWDVEQRLRSVTGPGGETAFVYDASGQRVLRRTPDGRATLYLAGHEITVSATGSPVSAVRLYAFEGQLVATRTPAGVDYLVSDPAGSVEQAAPSGGQPHARRAYDPYGRVRAEAGDTATDRGFIGQVEDASTGLSYLNARYYDATAAVFISTDAVYDPGKVKSLNPYTYSLNNPTTYADPSGMYSMYAWGLEVENSRLRAENKDLRAHIRQLGNHISDLQGVIRKQQRQINRLITYARALEAELTRQASIIRRLQARVAYLERVVVVQQREISRLRSVVARQQQIIRYQAGVIRYQAGVISYYKGVVNVLGFRLWVGTPRYASVMASIHSFAGVPGDAFRYDRISGLQTMVSGKETIIAEVRAERDGWRDLAVDQGERIGSLEGSNARLRSRLEDAQSYGWMDFATDAVGMVPHPVGIAVAGQDAWNDFSCGTGLAQWWSSNMPNPFGAPDANAFC
jgi:RHS repeat-associated protein